MTNRPGVYALLAALPPLEEGTMDVDFDALYAQPNPARALCRWALADLPQPERTRRCVEPGCVTPLYPNNRSGYCKAHAAKVYKARQAAQYRRTRQGAPVAAVTVAPSPTATVAVPAVLTCPVSPTGRHVFQATGAMPGLPGVPTQYCIHCQPRDRARRDNWFAPAVG